MVFKINRDIYRFVICAFLVGLFIFVSTMPNPSAFAKFVEEFDIPEEKPAAGTQPTRTTPAQPETSKSKRTWTEPITGMEFVWVPGGCFQMGSNSGERDERPVHEVCLDGFWMGKYEVTQAQWQKLMKNNPSRYKGVQLPVENVSWYDANKFVQQLCRQSGKKFTLPTEAQWEYSARAGTSTVRFWGDSENQACQYANVHDRKSKSRFSRFTWQHHDCSDGYAETAPVGRFKPNNFGLYDMLGNVWEWCEDIYDENAYSRHSRNNPGVVSGGPKRVLRGGCWIVKPDSVRSANRGGFMPTKKGSGLGFRLVMKDNNLSGPSENMVTSNLSDQQLYNQARHFLDSRNYKKARELFKNLIQKFPASDKADNAQFWIADSFYSEKWFEKAILEYQTVIEKYPGTNKVPSAYLKQALAFAEIGQKANARLILKELIRKYPSSTEARFARKKLRSLN